FPTVSPLDADALRQAAREVRTAEDDLAALNAMVARPFLPTEQELRDAEQAFAQAKAARKELPPAWRRTLGAALCGTGMVILVGARLRQEEARAAWRRLAPDRQPSEVETIIAEWAAADRSGPQDRSDA